VTAAAPSSGSSTGAQTFVVASSGGAQPYSNVDPGGYGYEAPPDDSGTGAVVAMQPTGTGSAWDMTDWLWLAAGAAALYFLFGRGGKSHA
jgi:hypothetical protein